MAINKIAKNITLKIRSSYTSNSKILTRSAELVNIESTKRNLTLLCNKKIVSQGNKE